MRIGARGMRLGSVLLPAVAVWAVFEPAPAEACTATSAIRNGVDVVDIVCSPGDPPVGPFFTSYTGSTGDGNDTLTIRGGSILQGFPPPTVTASGPPLDPSTGFIEMLDGDDIVIITGGQIGTAENPISIALDDVLGAADGADTFRMSGGTLSGSVFGLGGGNTYQVSGGNILGSIYAGSENDIVSISGTAHIVGNALIGPDAVGLEDGNDRFTMTGGILDGAVSGGNGDDILAISGGTIRSFVFGNDGLDQILVSGGSIAGEVNAERVTLTGGTIGGNITGITSEGLFINDAAGAAPLNLRDGVVFSGDDAVAFIVDSDLARGGARAQVFNGFDSVALDNSTLGFRSGTIDIGQLTLSNGSTLFINGNVDMPGSTLIVSHSSVNMIDGAADDVLTLGGLVLDNDPLGVDVNQRTITADQIVTGTLTATGVNLINVNLIGTPVFAGPTDIPIILTGGPAAGTFVATGLPGTSASLFTYQVLQGPDGLFLRAIPGNFGIALAPQNAVDVSAIDTALDALYGIHDDAIDFDLGLGNGVRGTAVSPTFGVFASGQFAHTEHDGFDISSNGVTGAGPGFGADDFSAAVSVDFNAAKHFGFEDRYGLNLGLFGGYASTDVELDGAQGFADVGHGDNRAGMFGGYGLFRHEFNYVLVSATGFFGQTDVFNGVFDTSGNYGTEGYAVTASAGHIFILSERMRFDLRGGVLGVSFRGDDYVDSGGNSYGGSEISFGALKLEPGIYADFQLDNGMTISPYARADFQQRFGYKNTASIDTAEVDFDDADFSAALSTGFNLKMSATTTMSGEVRGKLSSDSATIGGKLGVKVAF